MDETLYYYVENETSQGPYVASQLATIITPTTLVWAEGMPEWVPASQIPEINAFFVATPPVQDFVAENNPQMVPNFVPQEPYYNNQPDVPPAPQKKTNIGLIIALAVVALIALAAVGYIIYSNNTTKIATTTYGETTGNTSDADSTATEGVNNDQYPYEFLCERSVTYDDIAGKSSAELRIMRNYIFARHSYIFKSADLREYFSQFSWYTPKYTDVTRDLSKMEQNNVQYIKKHE